MPDQHETGAPAPLNPLAAFTLVLAFPGRTFQRLKDHPHWIMPLLFVVLCSMVSGAYAVVGGHLDGFLRSIALRTGQDPDLTRSAFLASTVISSIVGVPLVLLLESLFYKLSGMLRGGRARFSVVLSAVAYASVPIGLGALVIAGLMAITGSYSVGANLAFLVDGTRHPVLWSFARQLDLFSIWFFILLGIAAEHVFELPRPRGRQVGLLFAVFYLFIMSISGIGNAGQFDDPYIDWTTEELTRAGGGVVVAHHAPDPATDEAARLNDAVSRLAGALDRAEEVLGLPEIPRIDVYLYPSLEAKRVVTDNGELAHAVEWANVVHVACEDHAERAFSREAVKVSASAAFGSMYNPFIREGLGVAASGTWGGRPIRVTAGEIVTAGMFHLAALLDPVEYERHGRGTVAPLAGSFVEFVLATRGTRSLREMYVAQGDRAGPAVEAVESALGVGIEEADAEWKAYLRGADDTSQESPHLGISAGAEQPAAARQ